MKHFPQSLAIWFTFLVCVIFILGSLWYYKGNQPESSKSDASTIEKDFFDKYVNIPKDALQPDDKTRQDVVTPVTNPSLETEEGKDDIEKDSTSGENSNQSEDSDIYEVSEDQVSKLWFDLRRDQSDLTLVETFVLALERFLSSGKIPQVVDNFPLVFITEEDFGFMQDEFRYGAEEFKVITLVLPKGFEKRVIFFIEESKNSYKVVRDLNVLPSYFGRWSDADGDYYFIGGDYLNKDIFTLDGMSALFGLVKNSQGVSFAKVEVQPLYDAVTYEEGNMLVIKGISKLPFFYNDIIDEGQSTEELYLVTGGESFSHIYKVIGDHGSIKLIEER